MRNRANFSPNVTDQPSGRERRRRVNAWWYGALVILIGLTFSPGAHSQNSYAFCASYMEGLVAGFESQGGVDWTFTALEGDGVTLAWILAQEYAGNVTTTPICASNDGGSPKNLGGGPPPGKGGGGNGSGNSGCSSNDTNSVDSQSGQYGGDPVNEPSGNVVESFNDYGGYGPCPLVFNRFYNSLGIQATSLGPGWSHNYSASLFQPTSTTVIVVRGNQSELTFTLTGSKWTSDADVNDVLTQQTNSSGATTSWVLKTGADSVETYNASGQLITIATRAGLIQTLSYNASNQLSTVTDQFGHMLSFTYGTNTCASCLATMTDPAGRLTSYAYNANDSLASVTWPDGSGQQYLYANNTYPFALTAVVDELGVQYATFTYDSNELASTSSLASGVGSYAFSYGTNTTAVTDALGRMTTYGYTPLYQISHTANVVEPLPNGSSAQNAWTYDANGNIASYTDFDGNTTSYSYDLQRNLLVQEIRPDGRLTKITWSPKYRLPTEILIGSQSDQRTYDAKGNLLQRVLSDTSIQYSRTWAYTYNAYGEPLTATDPNGNITKFAYTNGNLSSKTDPLGHVTRYSYDTEGKRLTMTTPDALVTAYGYDTRGRLITMKAGQETTTYAYDAIGNLTTVVWPSGYQIFNSYDSAHRLVAIKDGFGNQINYTLDPLNNRTAEVHTNASSSTVYTHSWTYDVLNRVAQSIGASSQTTTLTYDPNGNLLNIADPLGNVTQMAYDSINRVSQFTAADDGNTRNMYDAFDQLIGVTDPRSLSTVYTIDALGDTLAVNSPDAGNSTTVPDAAGNVVHHTDANGHPITYSYDALNRLTQITRADTGAVIDTYTYDQTDATHGHGIGHLTSMSDPSGSTNWAFDSNGHVTKKTQTIESLSFVTSYVYDAPSGNLLSMKLPSGALIQYNYTNGLIAGATITHKGTTQPLLSDLQYEPFNGPTSWTLGNGERDGRGYDLDGRITSDGVDTAVTYDEASRISGVTLAGTGGSRSYSYDPVGRLTGLVSTTGTTPYAYTYDLDGNRTRQTVAKATTDYTIGSSNNRLLTAATKAATTSYIYDADGSRLSDGTNTYVYDVVERLRNGTGASGTISYVYDGLGQRIAVYPAALGDSQGDPATATTAYPGSYFVYDESGHLIGEYNAEGKAIEETIYLGDIPFAVVEPDGMYYMHSDYRNAPRQIDNATQTAVWTWDPVDFGEGPANQKLSGTTFVYNQRFPGQYFDGLMLKNYNYFRDYDPALGRYLESDPRGLEGGIDPYTYVKSNPLSYVDPTGAAGVPVSGSADSSSSPSLPQIIYGIIYNLNRPPPPPPGTRPIPRIPGPVCGGVRA